MVLGCYIFKCSVFLSSWKAINPSLLGASESDRSDASQTCVSGENDICESLGGEDGLSHDPCHGRVVVLGAGLSGLSAAQTLRRAGCDDVIVLEAHNRIGGRASSWKVERGPFAGTVIGARWVHGGSNNLPLAQLLSYFGIRMRHTGGDCRVQSTLDSLRVYNGSNYMNEDTKALAFDLYRNASHAIERLAWKLIWRKKDMSEHELLQHWENETRTVNGSPVQNTSTSLLRWQQRLHLQHCVGASSGKDLGVRLGWLADYKTFLPADRVSHEREEAQGDAEVIGGYEVLVEALAVGLDVRLASPVVKVVHSSDAVYVTLASGTQISAAALIVTTSVAAEKADPSNTEVLRFEPALPGKRAKALSHLRMSLVVNILVRLSKAAFSRFVTHFDQPSVYLLTRFLSEADDDEALLTYCVADAPDVLLCATVGAAGRQAVRLSPEALRAALLLELKAMLPDFRQDDLLAAEVFAWEHRPYIHGAWSYGALGSSSDDIEELAKPVGRLHFAGEATCRLLYGTATAAVVSGARAAAELVSQRIMAALNADPWPLFNETLRNLCDRSMGNGRRWEDAKNVGEAKEKLGPGGPIRRSIDYFVDSEMEDADEDFDEGEVEMEPTTDSVGEEALTVDDEATLAAAVAAARKVQKVVERDEMQIPKTCIRMWRRKLSGKSLSVFQPWTAMSSDVRRSWKALGWDIFIWDRGAEHPATVMCEWADLTDVGREAAHALDFNESTWPNTILQWWDLASCRASPWEAAARWDDFPLFVRLHFEALGWTRAMFSEGLQLPAQRPWRRLEKSQRHAAIALGYSQSLWDRSTRGMGSKPSWACHTGHVASLTQSWHEMDSATQANWISLGWTASRWGTNETLDRKWTELSDQERQAARRLGFNQQLWEIGT